MPECGLGRQAGRTIVVAINVKALEGRMRTIWRLLKQFAPYAAIELLLPGGTILAILCWLWRRRQVSAGAVQHLGSALG